MAKSLCHLLMVVNHVLILYVAIIREIKILGKISEFTVNYPYAHGMAKFP